MALLISVPDLAVAFQHLLQFLTVILIILKTDVSGDQVVNGGNIATVLEHEGDPGFQLPVDGSFAPGKCPLVNAPGDAEPGKGFAHLDHIHAGGNLEGIEHGYPAFNPEGDQFPHVAVRVHLDDGYPPFS